MSKWVKTTEYEEFMNQRRQEKENSERGRNNWSTEKGTAEKPNVYSGRLLQDPTGKNYKKILYHLYKRGENWQFVLCQKTFDFNNFCPFCSLTSVLYSGTESDKKMAGQYKRKEKFAANWCPTDDPRDADKTSPEDKAVGKIWIYEFPKQVESKIWEEMKDQKNGLGIAIFDPGEDGYDLILKVGATKPTKEGTTFPDYSNSTFARKASALGSDKEIGKLLEDLKDLDEHVKAMAMSDEDMKALIEEELLWDLVEKEWNKHKGSAAQDKPKEEPKKESKEPEKESKEPEKESEKEPEKERTSSSADEDDLMAELDALKNG